MNHLGASLEVSPDVSFHPGYRDALTEYLRQSRPLRENPYLDSRFRGNDNEASLKVLNIEHLKLKF